MLVSECCIVMLLEEDLLDLGTEPNCSVLSEMIPYEYDFVSDPKSHVGWGVGCGGDNDELNGRNL